MNKTSYPQGSSPPSRLRGLPVRLAVLAAFGPLLAGGALAQDTYMYFGLGPGQTRGVFNDQRMTDAVVAPGAFTNYSIATDRRDAGYKLFLGYQMNRYVGFELGYFNLGKYGFANTTTPNGRLTGEIRAQGANLDVVGTLPVTEKFAVLGRVGTVYARTRAEFQGTGAVTVTNPHPSRREANMKLGVGMQYAFNDSFMMRAEGEDYRVNDGVGSGKGHIRMYSVSFVFPFGRTGAAPQRTAYVERPVQAAPMQEPVVVMAPPEPRVAPMPEPVAMAPAATSRRVSYSAENLFGFDSSTVRPEGKVALDGFAAELDGTTYVNIKVEGYTDRIGTDAYNQALSVRRAEAVKGYLVSSGRVDPAKISTTGLGEGTPQTKAADCQAGDKRSASLVACLQPDRRVEIEVSGTR
jgi:OOP family OmpA-OmpF porin